MDIFKIICVTICPQTWLYGYRLHQPKNSSWLIKSNSYQFLLFPIPFLVPRLLHCYASPMHTSIPLPPRLALHLAIITALLDSFSRLLDYLLTSSIHSQVNQ